MSQDDHREYLTLFRGRIISLTQERVRLPNGYQAELEIVHHPGGAAVVALDSLDVLPLELDDIKALRGLAGLDWSAIEPSIFGTLFERGLDLAKCSQLGAHYTDRGSIMRLVDPVVLDPLRDEWAAKKAEIDVLMAKAAAAKFTSARTKAVSDARGVLQGFLDRLARFRVLDPACGSGNFLLLCLLGLKDLEHQIILEAEALGLPRAFTMVGPENVLGIELNPYAAELARVTVWIGEIQWMLSHGFSLAKNPVLKPLQTIEQRDAVVNPDGTEPEWPEADVNVGNPPFLGDKKMLAALGDPYVTRLRKLYQSGPPGRTAVLRRIARSGGALSVPARRCSLGLCTWLGVGNDPRYTPTTTFETFPFPQDLTVNGQQVVAHVGQHVFAHGGRQVHLLPLVRLGADGQGEGKGEGKQG